MNLGINMFYGASHEIFAKAKTLRKTMTPAEHNLWNFLKDGSFVGYKFRRQHPIGCYIADFYSHKLKLVIELDGSHHLYDESTKVYDKDRTYVMNTWGLTVIRYPNKVALQTPEVIVNDIQNIIETFENKLATLHQP